MTNGRMTDQSEAYVLAAFAPVHKRAFGVAVGVAASLAVLLATVISLVLDPGGQLNLALLSQYLTGYSVSLGGALIGAAWGFFIGFVAGWFMAFGRNLVLAAWIFTVRTRAELNATKRFIDHI